MPDRPRWWRFTERLLDRRAAAAADDARLSELLPDADQTITLAVPSSASAEEEAWALIAVLNDDLRSDDEMAPLFMETLWARRPRVAPEVRQRVLDDLLSMARAGRWATG